MASDEYFLVIKKVKMDERRGVMSYYNQAESVVARIKEKAKANKIRLNINTEDEINRYVAGKEGEERVSQSLKELTDIYSDMFLLNDVYFDLSEFQNPLSGFYPSMQIDHILISNHAMYVIETKKYPDGASIDGTSRNRSWEYKDLIVKKSSRENALKQNDGHIDNLKRIIRNTESINIVSIVCVLNMSPQNIKICTEYGKYLLTLEELPYMIEALEKKYHTGCIDEEQKAFLIEEIKKQNICCFEQEVNHIIYVKLLRRLLNAKSKGKRGRKKKK